MTTTVRGAPVIRETRADTACRHDAMAETAATHPPGMRLSFRGQFTSVEREEKSTGRRPWRASIVASFSNRPAAGSPAFWRAAGRRPSRRRTTLHWLRLGDFVPASDTLLRRELLPEAEKALGLKITLETINGNDLQARITSAIQSGTGADLIHAMHNWPQLYAESLVDVSDVAEDVAKQQGGFYDIFAALAKGEKGWLAVPWCCARHPAVLPQVLVRRDRRHEISRHLGELSGGRQAAQGEGAPDRTDARARLQ